MDYKKILKALDQYQSFLISTHVNPDPDGLASQIALAMYLTASRKKVYAVNEDKLPTRYSLLPNSSMIHAHSVSPDEHFDIDAALIVDCGDLSRIGKVQKLIEPGKSIINIDHHITNDRFGTHNLVVPGASSTAEIVYELLEAANFPLNKKLATLIYLGIMTDTGSFRYDNTTSRTHDIAARLMRFHLPVSKLYRQLYETVPLNDLKQFMKVVSHFDSLWDGKAICLELPRSVWKKFSEDFDLKDKIFRHLRDIKGAEVIAIFMEQDKNKTRINLRSHGLVNVAKLASYFDGGGHCRASGCMIPMRLKDARKAFLAKLQKELDRK